MTLKGKLELPDGNGRRALYDAHDPLRLLRFRMRPRGWRHKRRELGRDDRRERQLRGLPLTIVLHLG